MHVWSRTSFAQAAAALQSTSVKELALEDADARKRRQSKLYRHVQCSAEALMPSREVFERNVPRAAGFDFYCIDVGHGADEIGCCDKLQH